MRKEHILRRDVPMEFDVTAGPDRDVLGDGLGFDACGRGKKYLRMLMPYGASARTAAGRTTSSPRRRIG